VHTAACGGGGESLPHNCTCNSTKQPSAAIAKTVDRLQEIVLAVSTGIYTIGEPWLVVPSRAENSDVDARHRQWLHGGTLSGVDHRRNASRSGRVLSGVQALSELENRNCPQRGFVYFALRSAADRIRRGSRRPLGTARIKTAVHVTFVAPLGDELSGASSRFGRYLRMLHGEVTALFLRRAATARWRAASESCTDQSRVAGVSLRRRRVFGGSSSSYSTDVLIQQFPVYANHQSGLVILMNRKRTLPFVVIKKFAGYGKAESRWPVSASNP